MFKRVHILDFIFSCSVRATYGKMDQRKIIQILNHEKAEKKFSPEKNMEKEKRISIGKNPVQKRKENSCFQMFCHLSQFSNFEGFPTLNTQFQGFSIWIFEKGFNFPIY